MNGLIDNLAMQGGAIKALGESTEAGRPIGKLGGVLCRFTGPEDPDRTKARDFFDAHTNFKMTEGMATPVFYHHGLHPTVSVKEIGAGTLHLTADGVEIKSEVWLDDVDGARFYREATAGKLAWSSGTANHLVKRTPVEVKGVGISHHIDHWPLGLDASLTPTAAEPRNVAVAVKSLIEDDEYELKKYNPRQPRDDHGRWSDGAGGISTGHAAHVMKSEGVSDKDAAGVLDKIKDGTHKTREDVLAHIDAIHASNGKGPGGVGEAPAPEFHPHLQEADNSSRLDIINGSLSSNVRGGGTGASGWMAKITGTHERFGMEREFVSKDKRTSGSGRSGYIGFNVNEPGVYEYRNLGTSKANSHTEISGFLRVHPDGKVEDIEKHEALAHAKGVARKSLDYFVFDLDDEHLGATKSLEILEAGQLYGSRLVDHSSRLLLAVGEYTERVDDLSSQRALKSGRVLSEANHAHISDIHAALCEATERLGKHLKEHAPESKADDGIAGKSLDVEIEDLEAEELEEQFLQQETQLAVLLAGVA